MPPRWFSFLIVAVWLSLSGRLFVLDLLPRFLPGRPPPFTIDLVEEVRKSRAFTDWILCRDGQRLFRARTRVTNPEHDVFELTGECLPLKAGDRVPINGMLVRRLFSSYRVSGNGDLLGVAVEIDGTPLLANLLGIRSGADVRIDISGAVRDGAMKPRLRLTHPLAVRELPLGEVRVRPGESLLLPMHPVNRIQGLSPGQAWQMTLLDPVGDSLAALQGGGGEPRLLQARVRPGVERFTRGRRSDVPCLVIDYEGDGLQAVTWVERDRGLVLSQEATVGGETWVMYRE